MGKMSYISYLCETENEKELTEELGSNQAAKSWISAHKDMRENREKPAFKVLNQITDENIKEAEDDLDKAKKDSVGDLNKIISAIGYRGEV